MTPTSGKKTLTRVELTPGSVALVLLAIAAAVLAAEVLVSARRVFSWVVACAVVAALMELIVEWLDRWMKRPLAIVLVLLGIAGLAGLLAFGVFHDLDVEVKRLREEAPQAARQVEQSKELGGVAREIDLDRRVTEAVERLSSPSSGLAGEAVSSFGTYVVCAVLTILFLSWGPRVTTSAVDQLSPDRAARVRGVAQQAFVRSRRYVSFALLQSIVVGLTGWGVCLVLDIPAPAPLALSLAALALVPNLGILVGSLPILLLTAGLEPFRNVVYVALVFLALQVVSSALVQPRIVRSSGLYVGPTVVVIGFLLGFELYGIGGAMYAAALVVAGVAAIDASTDADDDVSPTPADAVPAEPAEQA